MITLQVALHILGDAPFTNGVYSRILFRRIKAKLPESLAFTLELSGTKAKTLIYDLDDAIIITLDEVALFNRDEANAFLIECTAHVDEEVQALQIQYKQSIVTMTTSVVLAFLSIMVLSYYYLNTRVIHKIDAAISVTEIQSVIDEYNRVIEEDKNKP